MKSVPGRGPVTSSATTQPSARPARAARVVAAMATPKPTTRVRTGQGEQGAPPPHQGQAEGGDGHELRAQDHGPDDQDLGVHDDRDAGQQGRERHERQVGPVELGLLVGALGDVGPHDRVGAAARGVPFGVEPGRETQVVTGSTWMVPCCGTPERVEPVHDAR